MVLEGNIGEVDLNLTCSLELSQGDPQKEAESPQLPLYK